MEINKRPIGFIILLVYLMSGVVFNVVDLIQDANHFMLLEYIDRSTKLELLTIIFTILNIPLIIGLYRYRRWAFIGFMIYYILVIILSIESAIFIDTDRIVEMGWRPRSFYFAHGFYIIGSFAVLLWLSYYGDKFFSPTDRIVRFFRRCINSRVTDYLEKK